MKTFSQSTKSTVIRLQPHIKKHSNINNKSLINNKQHINSNLHRKSFNSSLVNVSIAVFCLELLLSTQSNSKQLEIFKDWLELINNGFPNASEWYRLKFDLKWPFNYPPLYIWFINILSNGLKLINNNLKINIDLQIKILKIVLIFFKFLIYLPLQNFINKSKTRLSRSKSFVISTSIILSPFLIFVDNIIEFQFINLTTTLLFYSLFLTQKKKYNLSFFYYLLIICFNKNYIWMLPSYIVFILRVNCIDLTKLDPKIFKTYKKSIKWKSLLLLIFMSTTTLLIIYGPWLYLGQIDLLWNRLVTSCYTCDFTLTMPFPAPNIWSIYSFFDKVISFINGIPFVSNIQHLSSTSLNHTNLTAFESFFSFEQTFSTIPNVTRQTSFFLIIFYQLLSLIPLFLVPTYERFYGSITLCLYSSFLVGWHINTNELIQVIFPMSLIVINEKRLIGPFTTLITAGYSSILFASFNYSKTIIGHNNEELLYISDPSMILKIIYTFAWIVIFNISFENISTIKSNLRRIFYFDRQLLYYKLSFIPLLFFLAITSINFSIFEINEQQQLDQKIGKLSNLKLNLKYFLIYLPISFIKNNITDFMSFYCAIGVVLSWTGFSWLYFFDETLWDGQYDVERIRYFSTYSDYDDIN